MSPVLRCLLLLLEVRTGQGLVQEDFDEATLQTLWLPLFNGKDEAVVVLVDSSHRIYLVDRPQKITEIKFHGNIEEALRIPIEHWNNLVKYFPKEEVIDLRDQAEG